MNHRFKIGDKVRIKQTTNGATEFANKIGTIVGISGDGVCLVDTDDTKTRLHGWHEHLELLNGIQRAKRIIK
jgi:hypothetical protein